MKRFFTIYEFELKSYLKNKSFTITTILLVVLLFAATFLPRFFDMSDMLGIEKTSIESGDNTDTSDERIKQRLALLMKPAYLVTCLF